jgi:hypothetical protein
VGSRNDYNPLSDRLLEHLRGELPPVEAAEVEAALRRDPALAAERRRLEAFLSALASAHEVELDEGEAARVAARARDRVRREEGVRVVPAPRGRPVWARVLAASVAVHVAVLGFLSLRSSPLRPKAPDPVEPVVTVAGGGGGDVVPVPADDGDLPAGLDVRPYAVPEEDLPIQRVFSDEPALPLPAPTNAEVARFVPGTARAMALRSSARGKEAIRARLGAPPVGTKVATGLAALARLQAADGGFEPAGSRSRDGSTALVLLAFLSEGNSSRAGPHAKVVERGVARLRAGLARPPAGLEDRALVAMALAEDLMLAHGALTPADHKARTEELRAAAAGLAPAGGASDASGAWRALALESLDRVGLLSKPDAAASGAVLATLALPGDAPDVLRGSQYLLGKQVREFRLWSSDTLPALARRLGSDGLARGASEAERAEETALVLLAMAVPYRTY